MVAADAETEEHVGLHYLSLPIKISYLPHANVCHIWPEKGVKGKKRTFVNIALKPLQ
jgi:hypothetical protein